MLFYYSIIIQLVIKVLFLVIKCYSEYKRIILVKEPSEDKEVHGYDHGVHGQRSPHLGYTHPQEELQEQDMEGIVNEVTECKARTVAPGGACAEGEVVRQQVVHHETQRIAYRVGEPSPQPQIEQQIHSVVYPRRHHAHYAKPHHLFPRPRHPLPQLLNLHHSLRSRIFTTSRFPASASTME